MPYPISDHYDGQYFFNPEPTIRSIGGKRMGLFGLLRARMKRDPAVWSTWPKRVENTPYPAPAGEPPTLPFIGHSSFLIRLPGINILTDPVFSARCSPVQFAGPKRVRDPGLTIEALPEINLILLSHNHYDHMDLISLRKIKKRFPFASIVTTLGNAAYLARKGLGDAVELDWWQAVEVGEANITVVPARHFAARWLNDRNQTLWGGFWIGHASRNIYFAGDTGMTKYFKEIHARLGAPDLALLPIGAYEPQSIMAPVHINPAEAVRAFHDLGAKRAVGMHFGTFQLTAEAIDAPLQALAAAKGDAAFETLDFGQTVTI